VAVEEKLSELSEESKEKWSLKEVVQDILGQSKDGLEMKEVVSQVKELINKGEYTSKAENVSAVVAQALFHLQKDGVVRRNKETKRYLQANAVAVA
jgi:hypothetical protein